MANILLSDRIKGAFWGFVVGDALGVPVKNQPRVHREIYPMEGMTGWGTYNLPPGHWSDESSILLSATEAFIDEGVSYASFFEGLKKWYYNGAWNAGGEIVEINEATKLAIESYASKMEFTHQISNEDLINGSDLLGVTIPVVFMKLGKINPEDIPSVYIALAGKIHRTPITFMAFTAFHLALLNIVKGTDFDQVIYSIKRYFHKYFVNKPYKNYQKHFESFLNKEYQHKENIVSDQNMVHVLECSFWALHNSKSYLEAVLNAVNLGEQTDTVSAVTGALAGAYYGFNAIPEDWKEYLPSKNKISKTVMKFMKIMTENI